MQAPRRERKTPREGFSLLELLITVVLLSVMMAAVISQISEVQQRARTEQVKVDIFQEAREFADQLVRDLHQTGYPSIRMFDTTSWSPALASPSTGDSRLATGVTLIGAGEVRFEADVDGSGNVSILDYSLQATGNNCPCLQRSQVLKSSGGTSFSNEIQNVQSAGTNVDPIFVGYTASGVAVTSADMTTTAGKQALATIKTIEFRMKVRAAIVDPVTLLAPETTLGGQITIGNCSLDAMGQSNSC